MQLEIHQMSDADAARIAAWRYDPPYDFYNDDANADDLALLLAAEHREGTSFSAFDTLELVGFYAFRQAGDDIVFGLGLRPDLTGRGLGLTFLRAGLEFARTRFAPRRFRLFVATFNERAMRVYMRAGFVPVRLFDHETNGGLHPFVEMTLRNDAPV